MSSPSPYISAGTALEPLVYQMVERDFGHRVKFRNHHLTWTREGTDFPILSRYIDGMIKWLGEPQVLEIKTTSSRNFNFVLQSIREDKPCDSLAEYRDQMQVYAAMLRGAGWNGMDLPARLRTDVGVLALLNRDNLDLKLIQISLDDAPSAEVLEPHMRELEVKLGVSPQQQEAREAVATAIHFARRTVREAHGRFRQRFGNKF